MTERQVAVIGLGLIGASLGGALRAQGYVVRGLDQDTVSMQTALDRGLVDEVGGELAAVLRGADLVILAIPVLSIIRVLPQIDALAPSDAVIIDVGSVKGPVVDAMAKLAGAARVIGGHPIAGKEQAGPAAADIALFRGTLLCARTERRYQHPDPSRRRGHGSRDRRQFRSCCRPWSMTAWLRGLATCLKSSPWPWHSRSSRAMRSSPAQDCEI